MVEERLQLSAETVCEVLRRNGRIAFSKLEAWVMMMRVRSQDDVRFCFNCGFGSAWFRVSVAFGSMVSDFRWVGVGVRDIHNHLFCES